jgi:hypothetical protein
MAQGQVETSAQALRRSLEERDLAFSRLMTLIPARYYIVDTPEEVRPAIAGESCSLH